MHSISTPIAELVRACDRAVEIINAGTSLNAYEAFLISSCIERLEEASARLHYRILKTNESPMMNGAIGPKADG
jgi:hypothetical protein